MPARKFLPDKILSYAQDKAETAELPILLVHLDAYSTGVRETKEVGRIQHRDVEVEDLILRAHEATREIQRILVERGWKLKSDAKTWVAP